MLESLISSLVLSGTTVPGYEVRGTWHSYFKIDGTINKFPSSTRYTLKSLTGNRQLDDKDEFTVLTDNIAQAVTNLQYEYVLNEEKREINVLAPAYVQLFINDLRDIVRYDKSSSYISKNIAGTENTNVVNP